MPIYEFYCAECHTIYSFRSRTVNTKKRPPCPRNGEHTLERQVSSFAVISGGRTSSEDPMDDLPMDESRMESAMASLASEAEGMDEEDPRAAARMMRKLSDATGLEYGDTMQEALRRLEAGEDPESVEAEMGDALESDEDPFVLPPGKSRRSRRDLPPGRDEKLYDM